MIYVECTQIISCQPPLEVGAPWLVTTRKPILVHGHLGENFRKQQERKSTNPQNRDRGNLRAFGISAPLTAVAMTRTTNFTECQEH